MSPQRTIALAVLALSAAMTGPRGFAGPPQPTTEQQSIRLGQDLAARNCGMCHALDRTHPSPDARAPAFPALGDRLDVENLGEGLATGILTRHPEMPEFRFAPHEVVAIVRYLRSIQDRQHT